MIFKLAFTSVLFMAVVGNCFNTVKRSGQQPLYTRDQAFSPADMTEDLKKSREVGRIIKKKKKLCDEVIKEFSIISRSGEAVARGFMRKSSRPVSFLRFYTCSDLNTVGWEFNKKTGSRYRNLMFGMFTSSEFNEPRNWLVGQMIDKSGAVAYTYIVNLSLDDQALFCFQDDNLTKRFFREGKLVDTVEHNYSTRQGNKVFAIYGGSGGTISYYAGAQGEGFIDLIQPKRGTARIQEFRIKGEKCLKQGKEKYKRMGGADAGGDGGE